MRPTMELRGGRALSIAASLLLAAPHPLAAAQRASCVVLLHADPVPRYERLELTVSNGQTYTNPFDPTEIDVWGNFVSAAGTEASINGFWDGTEWKLRFSAAERARTSANRFCSTNGGLLVGSGAGAVAVCSHDSVFASSLRTRTRRCTPGPASLDRVVSDNGITQARRRCDGPPLFRDRPAPLSSGLFPQPQ